MAPDVPAVIYDSLPLHHFFFLRAAYFVGLSPQDRVI